MDAFAGIGLPVERARDDGPRRQHRPTLAIGGPRPENTSSKRTQSSSGVAHWASCRSCATSWSVWVTAATLAALTNTERKIAELVAEGLTNAEVAAQLYVSARTVEAHLTQIYRKEGVRGRVRVGCPPPSLSVGHLDGCLTQTSGFPRCAAPAPGVMVACAADLRRRAVPGRLDRRRDRRALITLRRVRSRVRRSRCAPRRIDRDLGRRDVPVGVRGPRRRHGPCRQHGVPAADRPGACGRAPPPTGRHRAPSSSPDEAAGREK